MSKTLEERYQERKQEFDEYQRKLVAYQTRMQDCADRIAKSEQFLAERISQLPKDVYNEIRDLLPDINTPCTKDNARERLNAWRNVYTRLEQLGIKMLEGET